ncbi:polyhomeotic-like protein 3 [Bombina bombina]|uniref:polyhomeotic-like protein 3 n=1 Tax=Bombina bombina TaxID=8345 RepID=UPI00235AA614|nr:polyhomeotic-like protein 3 [Bombina bombina]
MENEQIKPTSSASATSGTSSPTQPTPVYSSSDRHAVQVIQQTLNRPASSAAHYLQQMYAAQQQHLVLQTTALQQQHLSSTQLQSLASVQQTGVSGERCSISTVNSSEQSNTPQSSINLSTSSASPLIINRSQTTSSTSSSINQKTMLLGSTSPALSASPAQMYLRAQMLIFTPGATVAAVQSDLPVTTTSSSSSCHTPATQVQNLSLRNQPMVEMPCPQKSMPKINSHDHLSICHKTTITSTKSIHTDSLNGDNTKGENSGSESSGTAVTCTSSLQQLISPVSYASVHPLSLVKQPTIPLNSESPKMSHHPVILQQQQQQIRHRHQIETISLHNPALEASSTQHCVPLQSQTFLSHSQQCTPASTPHSSSPNVTHSTQQSVVVSPPLTHSPCQSPTIIIHPQPLIQPQTPLLVQSTLTPRNRSHYPLQSTLQSVPHLTLPADISPVVSPGAHTGSLQPQTIISCREQLISPSTEKEQPAVQPLPPSIANSTQLSTDTFHIQSLPLQAVQAIAVQPEILTPGEVLVQNALLSEEELPAAEALVQLPYQILPAPQTMAVNLHIQPTQVETPVVYQVENVCAENIPVVPQDCVRVITQTPTPPTLSPVALPFASGEEFTIEHTLQGLPTLASSVSASVIKSLPDTTHASIPPPPLLLPAVTTRSTCSLKPNSIPGIDHKFPQAIVKPHILTHVIEGFVIQEGMEPFPVNQSSLLVEPPVKGQTPLDVQFKTMTGLAPETENTATLPDNFTDREMDDLTTEEGAEEMECMLLKCEFCGKTGYPKTFLRSKRFCSISCTKRYNSKGTKHIGLFKTGKPCRWNRKIEGNIGQRGRQPSNSGELIGEHFLRQLPTSYSCPDEALEASQEESTPVAMTTRLRRQSERDHQLRFLQIRKATSNSDLPVKRNTEPSLWTVEDVWTFISSLPGCHDVAEEFRTQEIDGQALLLLKEDHLMNTMNIKLGPALKICAQINLLKET